MIEHDPDALRRRLARYFDTIPHLAYVAVGRSSQWGEPKLAYALDFAPDAGARPYSRAEREAERMLVRVARVLGARKLVSEDPTWGPRGLDFMVYVRDQHHACWRKWLERCARHAP